jgi:hypothetical protein
MLHKGHEIRPQADFHGLFDRGLSGLTEGYRRGGIRSARGVALSGASARSQPQRPGIRENSLFSTHCGDKAPKRDLPLAA